MENLIQVLCTLPATDVNFTSALNRATKAQLQLAIQMMQLNSEGKNKSRIEACERQIKKSENETKTKPNDNKPNKNSAKTKSKKEPMKIVNFPGKKPEITKLPETSETHTYEECKIKLEKAKETFKDADSAYVIEHLLEQCKTDQYLRNNIMRKDKSYEEFIEYMYKAAMSGYCIKIGNNCGMIEPQVGFELALDYFNMSDVKNVDKKEVEQELNTEVNKIVNTPEPKTVEGISMDANGQMSFNF